MDFEPFSIVEVAWVTVIVIYALIAVLAPRKKRRKSIFD
jgi:hypothetical protein